MKRTIFFSKFPMTKVRQCVRFVMPMLLTTILVGCAAQVAYRDGVQLIEEGQYEQGLKRLNDAVNAAPDDSAYRNKYLKTRESIVQSILEDADLLIRSKNLDGARAQYQKILKLEQHNVRAIDGLKLLDREAYFQTLILGAKDALAQNNRDSAINKLRTILIEVPNHIEATAIFKTIISPPPLPIVETKLAVSYRKPITIEFKDASVMQIFEIISKSSGLNFIFDREVRADQRTSIFLKNSTVESAIYFTLLTNQLALQVLDSNTILIFPNTQNKLKEYQEMVVKTFFLTNANAKDVATTLTTIIKSKELVVDEKLNAIILRDNPDAIKIAEKLILLQDVAEPEVMLEVEVLEIKRSQLQELGINWPDNLALTPLIPGVSKTLTLRDLTNNIDSRTTGVSTPTININAKAQDSNVKILANPRIRTRNLETATIQIGERVPNVTTTSTTTGFVSESVTYTDVGLKLEVQPKVFLDNDVGIRVKLEVSNVVSQSQTKSGSVTYQLGTRNASTSLRLKDGETQILAGLINNEDRSNANKVPGLGSFPIIGRLFGSTADNSQKTEIVLSITPRLIRNIHAPQAHIAEFAAGTDTSFRLRPENDLSKVSPNSQGEIPNHAQSMHQGSTSQLEVSLPNTVSLGETFTAHIAVRPKDLLNKLSLSIKVAPREFEIVQMEEGKLTGNKIKNTEMRFNSTNDGQINIDISGTNPDVISPSEIHVNLTFRALEKSDKAKIQLVAASGIKQNGETINLPLPNIQSVQVK